MTLQIRKSCTLDDAIALHDNDNDDTASTAHYTATAHDDTATAHTSTTHTAAAMAHDDPAASPDASIIMPAVRSMASFAKVIIYYLC